MKKDFQESSKNRKKDYRQSNKKDFHKEEKYSIK